MKSVMFCCLAFLVTAEWVRADSKIRVNDASPSWPRSWSFVSIVAIIRGRRYSQATLLMVFGG